MTIDEKQAKQIEFERLAAILNDPTKGESEFSPQEYIFYRDFLLEKWETSKTEMAAAQATEMDLRKQFVKFAFDPEKKSGTERIELANGYEAKAVKKVNYSVNQETVNSALDKIEALGPEGKFIAERLIKWKADLSLTEYKGLAPQYKVLIDEAVTTTDGAPTLEIIEPKSKKKM